MSWSSNRTWVAGEILYAADLNLYLRDQLNETAPAKVTTAGDIVYATGANALTRLGLPTKGYGYVAGASAPQGEPIVRKNRIINGDMLIWQRGNSTAQLSTADNAYTADRWRGLIGAAGAGRVSRSTDAPMGGSVYSYKMWIDASGNKIGTFQPIEGMNMWDLRGQAVSLQAKIRTVATLSGDVRMAICQSTAANMDSSASGDPVSAWNAAGTNPTLAAPWSYVNTPAALGVSTSWSTTPYKVENQAVSTAAVNLAVLVWNDSTSNSTLDFALVTDVQLEKGAVCTDFERLTPQTVLAQCQRYCEKSYSPDVVPGTDTILGEVIGQSGNNVGSTAAGNFLPLVSAAAVFKVTKFVTPTVSIYSSTGLGNAVRVGGVSNRAGVIASSPSQTQPYNFLTADTTSATAISTGNQIEFHWIAFAEL